MERPFWKPNSGAATSPTSAMAMPMPVIETHVGKAERRAVLTSLPNILTLSRIFAVPLLVALMWDGGWLGYAFAFALYCVAGITDYLDGYLDRAQGTVSMLGVFLHPIPDPIMIAAVIVTLIAAPTAPITVWQVLPPVIILTPEARRGGKE